MYCEKCGAEFPEGANFCSRCGTRAWVSVGSRSARPAADGRVCRALDSVGLRYVVDPEGDFRLDINFDDGRSQRVFVRSSTEQFHGLEVREVYSAAHQWEGGVIPEVVANRLLEQNGRMKLGAWAKIGRYAMFVSTVDANADANALSQVIQMTAGVADNMEEELTGGRDAF